MAHRNRVDPAGTIHAVVQRGEFFGNRGCIHNGRGEIVRKPPVRRWIICVTDFKDRKRKLLQPGRYTELFFLDEVTGLAAGHRPCFECRREQALSFAEAFAAARKTGKYSADEMDLVLDPERALPADDMRRLVERDALPALPDGAMIRHDDLFYAVRAGRLLPWSFGGYALPVEARHLGAGPVHLVTPAASLAALAHGYVPRFHSGAWTPGA